MPLQLVVIDTNGQQSNTMGALELRLESIGNRTRPLAGLGETKRYKKHSQ